MAKKLISSGDLGWIIIEQLRNEGVDLVGLTVVTERKQGDWRVVLVGRSQSRMGAADLKRLATIETKLRAIYAVRD